MMERLDARFPGYGFARNKGYATADHRQALHELGPSSVHRLLFAPVLDALRARSVRIASVAAGRAA